MGRTHVILVGAVCALIVAVAAIYLSGKGLKSAPPQTVTVGQLDQRLREIERQLDELRETQARGRTGVQADAARTTTRRPSRWVSEDPESALQASRRRENLLERTFQQEPLIPAWASLATAQVEDALALSAEGAGMAGVKGAVECRSRQCRIAVTASAGESYEDLLTYLSVELADFLPSSTLVVKPKPDGSRDITIFANSQPASARATDG